MKIKFNLYHVDDQTWTSKYDEGSNSMDR